MFRCKKSGILIVAIWTLFFLSTFSIILGYNIRGKLQLLKRLEQINNSFYLLDGAIKKAVAEIIKSKKDNCVILQNKNTSDVFEETEITFCDSTPNAHTFLASNNLIVQYGIFDEERRININTASLGLLKRLFQFLLGIDEIEAQELAASVIDWRDSDSLLSIPLGSAEDSYYRSLRYPYEAKDKPFEILEELLLVKGMNYNYFEKIKKFVTIYGDGKININTAPREIFLILGLDENTVDKLISFRNGEDGLEGTSDDNVFYNDTNIMDLLKNSNLFNEAELLRLNSFVEEYFKTTSDFFRIRATIFSNKKAIASIYGIVNSKGKILYQSQIQ